MHSTKYKLTCKYILELIVLSSLMLFNFIIKKSNRGTDKDKYSLNVTLIALNYN